MAPGLITVVGSANMDLVMSVPRFPRPGETLLGGKLSVVCGGKGANQAVALARLGANVEFIGCIGSGGFGSDVVSIMEKEGIILDNLKITKEALTGAVIIFVDPDGEHVMVPDYGANLKLAPDDIKERENEIRKSSLIMLQFELMEETNLTVVEIARKYGIPYMVNPAPLVYRGEDIIKGAEILTPNLAEAIELVGAELSLDFVGEDYSSLSIEDVYRLGEKLLDLGPRNVVITLGKNGSVFVSKSIRKHYGVFRVKQVDVTGAGDAFNAGLAYKLSLGDSIDSAIKFASAVAAIAVSRMGAQTSFPAIEEVKELINQPGSM